MIDGDTITVQIAGAIRTIRLIGVDTPETKHPTKAVQFFGREASAFTQAALDRQTVRLEADPAGDDSDRYDRLLALRLPGRKELQRDPDPRRVRHRNTDVPLLPEERISGPRSQARKERRGMWAAE